MYITVLVWMLVQDQVDTLTFQNQSLRDKAKRFEEALRRSADEQIVVSFSKTTSINQITPESLEILYISVCIHNNRDVR